MRRPCRTPRIQPRRGSRRANARLTGFHARHKVGQIQIGVIYIGIFAKRQRQRDALYAPFGAHFVRQVTATIGYKRIWHRLFLQFSFASREYNNKSLPDLVQTKFNRTSTNPQLISAAVLRYARRQQVFLNKVLNWC